MIALFQPRTLGWIDDPAVSAYDGSRCQACLVDMRCPKNVHHTLALAQQVIGDDAPMAAPPDGLGAHDRAPILAAELLQSRKACGEGLRQSIIRIVSKTAHPPISVRGRFGAARLFAKAAKFRDMLIADLPRRQRFGEAFTVELRIGARPRHRSHVDDEIDARFLEQISEFDDRSSGMTYCEEDVRILETVRCTLVVNRRSFGLRALAVAVKPMHVTIQGLVWVDFPRASVKSLH